VLLVLSQRFLFPRFDVPLHGFSQRPVASEHEYRIHRRFVT